MRYFLVLFLFLLVATFSILGFRGSKTTQQPIVVFPDMDFQPKYLSQGESDFFMDGRVQRPVVPGSVVRGYAWDMKQVFASDYENERLAHPVKFSAKSADGEWVRGLPIEVNNQRLDLGQDKFTLFCSVCHGAAGDGNGITKEYGMVATPTFHSDRLRAMPEGEIFNTITNGKGQMLGYKDKLSVDERWAVIAYLRTLQRAQQATLQDVPPQYRADLEQIKDLNPQ